MRRSSPARTRRRAASGVALVLVVLLPVLPACAPTAGGAARAACSHADLAAARACLAPRSASAEDVAAVSLLLTDLAGDPAEQAAALAALDGSGLTDLLVALDMVGAAQPEHGAAVAGAQHQVRAAVAEASTAWDDATTSRIAAGLLEGVNAATAVAYLVADPAGARVDLRLATAVGDALREWERTHDQQFTMLDSMGPSGAPSSPMTSTLPGLAHDGFGMLVIDPADLALRHLGEHGTDALGWLLADDRVAYWFGDRDWAVAAGHAAPAALWNAMHDAVATEDDTAELRRLDDEVVTLWSDGVLRAEPDLAPERVRRGRP
ncbi:MAG: hypothetical protein ABW025_09560 [Cellulomonas sp.]